jgi:Predicted alternative thymidylate synthase
MRKSFIKIIDPGLLKKTMEYVVENEILNQLPTYIKPVRITMVAEVNRLQSLFLCELLGSYSIQSQRYCRYDVNYQDNIIFENIDLFDKSEQAMLFSCIKEMTDLYLNMTVLKEESVNKTKYTADDFKNGIPIDDGRYILPMAYTCNKEMTLNGEQFLKLILLLYNNSGVFGDMYHELLDEIALVVNDIHAVEYIKTVALAMCGEARVVDKTYFDNIIGERENHNLIHMLDNGCVYTPMIKSGAGALMCTTCGQSAIEILDNCDEKSSRKITERVAIGIHHTSISEHSVFSFIMKQSVPCYNQYLRHRPQDVLREEFDLEGIYDKGLLHYMVLPDSIFDNGYTKMSDKFINTVNKVSETIRFIFNRAVNSSGSSEHANVLLNMKLDALKQLIPMGYQLRVICTNNIVNELYKCTKRICNKAQWEIGDIMREALSLIKSKIGDDNKLLEMARPGCCTKSGCGEGKFRCKDNSNVLGLFNILKGEDK